MGVIFMTCPVCGSETKVVDSASDVDIVIRKRKCVSNSCTYYFYTTEVECTKNEFDYIQNYLKSLRNKDKK